MKTIWNCSKCFLEGAEQICSEMERLGVPLEPRWRSFVLQVREAQSYPHLSNEQKQSIEKLITGIYAKRDYSPPCYVEALHGLHEIYVRPCKKIITTLVGEAASHLQEFGDLLSVRYTDVDSLGVTLSDLVQNGINEDELLAHIGSAFAAIKAKLKEDIRDLEHKALMDAASGLANRAAFENFLSEAVKKWLASEIPVALVFFDIDYFKDFNDRHGHRIGDQAIVLVAKQLMAMADVLTANGGQTLAARYGGEEFAVIVSGGDMKGLITAVEKVRTDIRNFNFLIRDASGNIVEDGVRLTVSAGIAFGRNNWVGSGAENILESSDKALYCAKAAGRDVAFLYDPDKEPAFVCVSQVAKKKTGKK